MSSSKVPIPRLERQPPNRPGKTRDRVQRACLSCRARKVKCDGGQPKCSNCSESPDQAPCIYASTRKDKLKTATEQNQQMTQLLRDLRERLGVLDRKKVDDMLVAVAGGLGEASITQMQPDKPNIDERGETAMFTGMDPSRDYHVLDEDLYRNEHSRATGFIGPVSEMQWIRRLHHVFDHANGTRERFSGPTHPSIPTSSCSFYLDDQTIDIDAMADPSEFPPFEITEKLVNCFMESVQNSFPILVKKSFTSQFYHLYTSLRRGAPLDISQEWRAMFNIVLAIGAAYSHLHEAEWRADARDHLVYHSRAFAAYLKDSWWYAHPDLGQMQLSGLLAFYYLAIGQIDRSWLVIGMTMRMGLALGMHVKNDDPTATVVKKEHLARMWWGIYSLEQVVSTIIGRPSIGIFENCSVPRYYESPVQVLPLLYERLLTINIPLPLSTEELLEATIVSQPQHQQLSLYTIRENISLEGSTATPPSRGIFQSAEQEAEPANCGSYLKSMVRIGKITQKAVIDLYSPPIIQKSWETVQGDIAELMEDLELWASSLPVGLNFFHHTLDQVHRRERTILEIYYYDTKILITRPCLHHIDRDIERQTQDSHDFNQKTAATCVASAKSITNVLPDNIFGDRMLLYQGPWWAIVHNIMRAVAVLLQEVFQEANSLSHDKLDAVPSLKKLVRCLRVMKMNNCVANRAYRIAMELLHKATPHVHMDISDLITEDLATSNTGASIFQCDQGESEEYDQGYLQFTEEHTRHFTHNQENPYNYTVSDPFGLPEVQAPIADLGNPGGTYQDYFENMLPDDTIYNDIFEGEL